MSKLIKKKKKKISKNNLSSLRVKKNKSSPLYSQLRKRVRQEEKFLFLRESNPEINWDQSQNTKVSFLQSQQINKRTNLVLRELAQTRQSRVNDYQTKTAWSLRKQRAQIRKVRGKIDETAYQNKLQERSQFAEKLSNYQGKLAREQFWSKKFQTNPISLAKAELMNVRVQPDYQPSRYLDAEIFAFKQREKVPLSVFIQPWLSHKTSKSVQFSSVFSGSPSLKKEEITREPLIADKLKEYQYKVNFYQLFGRLPHSEKEIRKFAIIDWEKEKDNFWALYGWQTRFGVNQRAGLIVHPLNDKLWTQTQKNILTQGSDNYYWLVRGNKENHHLPLFSSRHEHKKFFQSYRQAQEIWFWDHYDYQYLERNREKLTQIKEKLSSRWVGEIERIKEFYSNWDIKSYGQELATNLILAMCSSRCNCALNVSCDPTGSEPACIIGYVFSANNHWLPNQHPPLAPSNCPYLNSSQFGQRKYGYPNRWVQCGNTQPQVGESWHHDFEAWHRGNRGWGCHLGFPPVRSKKTRSRAILEKW